ncbi:MAG: hypothetical protein WD335_00385 [Candidatus Paceibacterota bacterium]
MATLHIYLDSEKLKEMELATSENIPENSTGSDWAKYEIPGINLRIDTNTGDHYLFKSAASVLMEDIPNVISDVVKIISFREEDIPSLPSIERGVYHHQSARAEVKKRYVREGGSLNRYYVLSMLGGNIEDMRNIYFAIRNRSIKPSVSYEEEHEDGFEKEETVPKKILEIAGKIFASK